MDLLQSGFAIPDRVAISAGVNGMPRVTLSHPSGAGAEVYLHGAHVTSWKSAAGEELFFVSRQSHFAAQRPIRGGIPVIFPQFGPGALPQHGFARTKEWSLAHSHLLADETVEVVLQLSEDPGTLALWPDRFWLALRLCLAQDSLRLQLTVDNTGKHAFPFQTALHTYFAVSDIGRVAVQGLQGVTFVDSLRADAREVEARPAIRFSQEVDRVYVQTPDILRLEDEGRGRTLRIEKANLPDVVVWNPWIEKSRRMADFGDEEYHSMVCVETGVIDTPMSLEPAGQWVGETTYRIEEAPAHAQ